jgi:hypothetical protein
MTDKIDLANFWDTYLSQTLPNYTLAQIKGVDLVDAEGMKHTYKTMANIFADYSGTVDDAALKEKYKRLKDDCNRIANGSDALNEDNKSRVQVLRTQNKLELVQFDKNLLDQDVIMHSVIDKDNLEFKVKTNGNIVAFGEGDPFSKADKTEQEEIYERVNKMFNRLALFVDRSYFLVEFDGKDFTPTIFNNKDKYSTQKELVELYKELGDLPHATINGDMVDLSNVHTRVLTPVIYKLIAKMIQCILYKMFNECPDMFVSDELYLMRLEPIKRLATAGAGRSMATIFPHNDQCLATESNTIEGIDRINCDLVSIIYYDVKNTTTLVQDKYTSAGFFFSEDIPNPLLASREKDQMATSSDMTDFIKYINVKPRLITNVPVKSGSYAIWRNSGKYLQPMTEDRKVTDKGGNQLFQIKEEDNSFKYINPKIDFTNSTNIKNNIFTWHISPLNILNKTEKDEYHVDSYDSDIVSNIYKGITELMNKAVDADEIASYTLGAVMESKPKQYKYMNKDGSYTVITSDNINKLEDETEYELNCSIDDGYSLDFECNRDNEGHVLIMKKSYLGKDIKKMANQYVSPFVDRNFMTVRRSPFNPFRTIRDLFNKKLNVAIECNNIIKRIMYSANTNTKLFSNITKVHKIIYGGSKTMGEQGRTLPLSTPVEILNDKARAILYKFADELYQDFLINRGTQGTFKLFIESLCKLDKKINEILQDIVLNEEVINEQATKEVMEYSPADSDVNNTRYQYYQKYLKYKQKYIQLKNKSIARK